MFTPVNLNKYDSNVPDLCVKCSEIKGKFFHCVWKCRKVNAFWREVKRVIQKIQEITSSVRVNKH